MKTVAVIVLLSCCAFGQDKVAQSAAEAAACGPHDVEFDVNATSAHPTPVPEIGKAVIYFVQASSGFTRVGIDGKWVGALKRNTYLSASVESGEHHLCASGRVGVWRVISLRGLNAEAGMTYYFIVHSVNGINYIDYSLRPADADEGKYFVAGASLSTSHPK